MHGDLSSYRTAVFVNREYRMTRLSPHVRFSPRSSKHKVPDIEVIVWKLGAMLEDVSILRSLRATDSAAIPRCQVSLLYGIPRRGSIIFFLGKRAPCVMRQSISRPYVSCSHCWNFVQSARLQISSFQKPSKAAAKSLRSILEISIHIMS